MRHRDEQPIDQILVLHVGRGLTAGTAVLRAIHTHRLGLGVAIAGERDDDRLVFDEIFHRQLGMIDHDLGPSLIAVLGADRDKLFPDHRQETLRARQDVRQVADALEHIGVLGHDLVALKACESVQTQIQNCLRLYLGEPILAAVQP